MVDEKTPILTDAEHLAQTQATIQENHKTLVELFPTEEEKIKNRKKELADGRAILFEEEHKN